MRRLAALLIFSAAAPLLGGCSVLGYYQQGLAGQFDLMRRSQPIEQMLADHATEPVLRERLRMVLAIRKFAVEQLQLPDNGSYLHYADLERPFVVWNVFATPEFSLDPIQSCFPLVGCLSYRGYFNEAQAIQAAQRLAVAGNDVYVGGVAAYSTLGWFRDPVLSSMLRWDDIRLARLVFHELAHQKLYVQDDSDFNEAFATAVGEIGVQRWLKAQGRQHRQHEWAAFRARQEDFLALVRATAQRLRSLYAIQADAAAMRQAKAEVLEDMRSQYRRMRDSRWEGYDGYDDWFATANNARIAAVATYHDRVPEFLALYESVDGDLERFYQACRDWAADDRLRGMRRPDVRR